MADPQPDSETSEPMTGGGTKPGFDLQAEWLETDGLGGYASGTVSGERTRRYHALLLTATEPPGRRVVLVNGFDAWVTTPSGRYAISSQRYPQDAIFPDGASRIEEFEPSIWPLWTFRLEDDTRVEQEIFIPHGLPAVVVLWRLREPAEGVTLAVRPFLSGRDYHSLHHENSAFDFGAEVDGQRTTWRPYACHPKIVSYSNGTYSHGPDWFRNFMYDAERDRGLEFLEDLASPGSLTWDLSKGDAVWILSAGREIEGIGTTAGRIAATASLFCEAEDARRAKFKSDLDRSADAYIVARGKGKTIIAGYPWFTDWGRDTFIALRGLCLASGRLDVASSILMQWAEFVSEGMLPNRFPDGDEAPEYNSVDASLWFIVAAHDYLEEAGKNPRAKLKKKRETLGKAIEAILEGYSKGTRFGIRADDDGLLRAGEAGVALTWMDAVLDGIPVTPRMGKPVEVQALWINALRIGASFDPKWEQLCEKAKRAFRGRFWNEGKGCLYDVVDADHESGKTDDRFRPNQIFAIGGLPFPLIEGERARRVVDEVEKRLWTPMGLRTLAPDEPGYRGLYGGTPRDRDERYHMGTAWPWLAGAFIEAWVRSRGGTDAAKDEARARFFDPMKAQLGRPGLGHFSEIADGDPPHDPKGCPFQAWSLGELIRLDRWVLKKG